MPVVPLGPARAELVVLNSRFIASLSPASSAEEARAFIAAVRAEFPDARHHVPAFVIGGGKSCVEYCSDDGEPSGTSGRPLLAVLKGSGLGDVAVVVTRYFGGTLLGTGGLVKAYSEAGRRVLALVRRAETVETRRLEVPLPYHLYERFRILARESGAAIADERFEEIVRIVLEVPEDAFARFSGGLAELSAGSVPARELSRGSMRRPLDQA